MAKIYLLTSTKWRGEIELRYDSDSYLLSYDNRAELNDEQRHWFLANMPRHLVALQNFVAAAKTATLTEVKADVTFAMFWDRYNDKTNSSRKNTQRRWDNMPKSEQLKAYSYVGYYFSTLPQGTRKKYAETYLNAELWNN